ncbi:hypothetical protein DCAR_0935298 [Daucus carota subsp. sativus]|uniref:EF-hand domain-containing protein n=1 Tax=Daucus carota subsp. sativus TaxID=79200 RepID=A0AAF1BDI9_DAUCS|nr:hypothetical protein DCAR_0935298 [Daucus carota subsp. sativus]
MDVDKNGQIDCWEFMQFLRVQGYKDYADHKLFQILDIDKSEGLDFWEVMTLYYIIKSGRPFCWSCQKFITAVYFVCVNCFEKSAAPVYLCPGCYEACKYRHSHGPLPPQFLDNYTILEAHRVSSLAKSPSIANMSALPPATTAYSSSSQAIVPAIFLKAYRALEMAASIGTLGVIVASCSIM